MIGFVFTKTNYSKLLLIISILFYILCLSLNPYFSGYIPLKEEGRKFSELFNFGGLAHLIIGWAYVDDGVANASWLANPCIFLCWRAFYKANKCKAVTYAVLANLFVTLFMLGDKVVNNEGGVFAEITRYDLGYWLWLASAIAAFVAAIRMKSTEEPESTD